MINIQGQESQKSSGAITRSQAQREFFIDKGMCDPSQVQDDKDLCDDSRKDPDRSDIDPWMIPGTKGFIPKTRSISKTNHLFVFNAKFRMILNSEEQSKKTKILLLKMPMVVPGENVFQSIPSTALSTGGGVGGTYRESTLSQS